MKLNNSIPFGVVYLYIFFLAICLQSCEEQVISGCTDPESTNYDALAEEDDGNCTYNSDRFLGIYFGGLDCPDNGIINISSDSTTIEVTQGVYETRDSVKISISAGPDFPPLSLDAKITDNTLAVSDRLDGVPFVLLGVVVLLDVSVDAVVELSAGDSELAGPIALGAVYSATQATLIDSECDYMGVRQ